MNINSRELVKIIMVKERLKSKDLARILSEKTGKKYTQQSILHKISKSSFRYDEVKVICDIFNYKIAVEKE